MRLSARLGGMLAVALVLAVAPASAMADGNQNHFPAGDYARGGSGCAGSLAAPTTLVVQNFAGTAAAKDAIEAETAWGSVPPESPGPRLQMRNGRGSATISCEPETYGRMSALNATGDRRTYLRLWANATSKVVAGSPVRLQPTGNEACAGANGPGKWVPVGSGYDVGRDHFAGAFGGPTPFVGPYPMTEVNWGNSQSIQQCNGSMVSSDGGVTTLYEEDGFGVKTGFFNNEFRGADSSTLVEVPGCPESKVREHFAGLRPEVKDALSDASMNTVSFGIGWGTVAPCSGAAAADWRFQRWSAVLSDLEDIGMRPIVTVFGAPPKEDANDPQWEDPQCNTGVPLVNTANQGALDNWRAFVKRVALTIDAIGPYGSQGPIDKPAIEVLNEPNTADPYFGNCNPDPGKYADILKYAVLGVDDSNTGISVITGSPAPHTNNEDLQKVAWKRWLGCDPSPLSSGCVFSNLDAQTKAGIDAIGVHPYRTQGQKQLGKSPATSAIEQVDQAQDLAADFSLSQPAWVIEVGTTTTGANVDAGENVGSGSTDYPSPPEDRLIQGLLNQDIYRQLRWAGVSSTTVYTLADPGNVGTSGKNGFGLFLDPGSGPPGWELTPKDAYCDLPVPRGAPAPC
jgi:hypothetical protein